MDGGFNLANLCSAFLPTYPGVVFFVGTPRCKSGVSLVWTAPDLTWHSRAWSPDRWYTPTPPPSGPFLPPPRPTPSHSEHSPPHRSSSPPWLTQISPSSLNQWIPLLPSLGLCLIWCFFHSWVSWLVLLGRTPGVQEVGDWHTKGQQHFLETGEVAKLCYKLTHLFNHTLKPIYNTCHTKFFINNQFEIHCTKSKKCINHYSVHLPLP